MAEAKSGRKRRASIFAVPSGRRCNVEFEVVLMTTGFLDCRLVTITSPLAASTDTTVAAMVASGFFVGAWLKMYPVESAIVTACHSGLGGTGDVAILSASNRMGLMPFAQISTRIGGAAMIVLATVLMKLFH